MSDFDLRYWSHKAADWTADYHETLDQKPVRSQVKPGDIAKQIDVVPPEQGQAMEQIFSDFEKIIPEGMTHWQHPRFFAYFPSNASPASIVAEQLAAAMSTQGMLWQTSPAATELEIKMVDWLRQSLGLPDDFQGTFQDTASTSTLCAILTMRERALDWKGNEEGLFGQPPLRIYASGRTHSSIDKALWIAGLGQNNLVKIPTDQKFAMKAEELRAAIKKDRAAGLTPAGVVICIGGTSIGACDNAREICAISKEEGLYTHVDAAWAGSAMICPEFRYLWDGVEEADSIVFNPHKWLGVSLECSAHFVKDPATLVRTLAIQPEYLKTYGKDGIVNFSEWSVTLGRRFRALKVWFMMRAYGLEGLRQRIRNHVAWAEDLADRLRAESDFEIITDPILSLFSFRFNPGDVEDLDELNCRLVNDINDDGRIYLTQGVHDGVFVIRFVTGQFDMEAKEIDVAFETITSMARSL